MLWLTTFRSDDTHAAPCCCSVPHSLQARLLAASRSIPPGSLTADERARNELGSILVFTHDSSSKEVEHCTSTMPKV
jgi:hypothetical protein